jgi:hypothetical protein
LGECAIADDGEEGAPEQDSKLSPGVNVKIVGVGDFQHVLARKMAIFDTFWREKRRFFNSFWREKWRFFNTLWREKMATFQHILAPKWRFSTRFGAKNGVFWKPIHTT